MLSLRPVRFLAIPLLILMFLLAVTPSIARAQEGDAGDEPTTTVTSETESVPEQTGESGGEVVAASDAVGMGVTLGLLTLVLVVVMGVVVLGAVGLGVIGLGAWIAQGDGG